MGRLEHFRGIVEADRTVAYFMYDPFAGGKMHPRGRVRATPEMAERAGEWR